MVAFCFQFLGIPPKGELDPTVPLVAPVVLASFQFLGIPPKGEPQRLPDCCPGSFEGFQFLGIPPKGEQELFVSRKGVGPVVSNF